MLDIIFIQGDFMVIYIDSLIFTNIIIDYLLLSLTALITKRSYSLKRMIFSSLVGGFSSLYIFVETFLVLDVLFQAAITSLILFISTGRCKVKNFILSFTVFLGSSFTLNGAAILISRFQKADIVLTDNMVYYLNVSPIALLLTTGVIYLAILIARRILDKRKQNTRVSLKVKLGENEFLFDGLVDTGNNIRDPFGESPIFIINEDSFKLIKLAANDKEMALRQRVIPAKTVGEALLLEAIRCDKAVILESTKKYEYERPIVAKATEKIDNDYNAIIPHAVLDRVSD